jgi:hypothetical protein
LVINPVNNLEVDLDIALKRILIEVTAHKPENKDNLKSVKPEAAITLQENLSESPITYDA